MDTSIRSSVLQAAYEMDSCCGGRRYLNIIDPPTKATNLNRSLIRILGKGIGSFLNPQKVYNSCNATSALVTVVNTSRVMADMNRDFGRVQNGKIFVYDECMSAFLSENQCNHDFFAYKILNDSQNSKTFLINIL